MDHSDLKLVRRPFFHTAQDGRITIIRDVPTTVYSNLEGEESLSYIPEVAERVYTMLGSSEPFNADGVRVLYYTTPVPSDGPLYSQ
ncbi:hypothetical protein [Deinococcus peraridilitoris]|uniref:Uncharacterized protein n=1 Tax=Deinococcus peraridilitoris (strain DSM 19664 / LMG 22246 / CIP 109416 / KR-200) TaxID=937777 RepID=K9ZXX5_DEIPD|nr:hypothetical protein [Deinococcus peraridilitoris]AFZ66044.1 hypothetical protein Deipe_0447 [Deinococcus peraridilitoris DSM 19664]